MSCWLSVREATFVVVFEEIGIGRLSFFQCVATLVRCDANTMGDARIFAIGLLSILREMNPSFPTLCTLYRADNLYSRIN